MIVPVKDAELVCASHGQGPVCLVPSGIGSKPYQRQMPARLAEHLTLVYVDLRGSGRSTGEATDLTFDVLADDLEAVRARLGVARVAVLGHSILGALAIEYGRRCPATVSHVIVAGTPPHGDMQRLLASSRSFFDEDASAERKERLRDNLARLGPDAPPRQAVLAQTPMRFFDAGFDPTPLFADAAIQPKFLPHVMGTLTRAWDVTAGADALQAPLLIAHGRYDYTVPHVLWDGVATALPHATFRLFERSGHQPFFEEPDAFTAALLGWMTAPA